MLIALESSRPGDQFPWRRFPWEGWVSSAGPAKLANFEGQIKRLIKKVETMIKDSLKTRFFGMSFAQAGRQAGRQKPALLG